MTQEEVQKFLAGFFKAVGAVDRNLSDDEIAHTKITELAWFDQQLDLDPEFKKEALFELLVKAFKKAFGVGPPELEPFDWRVFDREITIADLAKEIVENA